MKYPARKEPTVVAKTKPGPKVSHWGQEPGQDRHTVTGLIPQAFINPVSHGVSVLRNSRNQTAWHQSSAIGSAASSRPAWEAKRQIAATRRLECEGTGPVTSTPTRPRLSAQIYAFSFSCHRQSRGLSKKHTQDYEGQSATPFHYTPISSTTQPPPSRPVPGRFPFT